MALSSWQAAWEGQAQHGAHVLRQAVPGAAVEHIGSTSVPGLCAKPVIDLMLGLPSLAALDPAPLAALGYRYRPEHEAAIPERRYFTREADDRFLRVHLHVLVKGGRLWTQHLRFRDRLRHDVALREAYAQLKTQLAQQHAGDKAAYQAGKDPFIEALLRA